MAARCLHQDRPLRNNYSSAPLITAIGWAPTGRRMPSYPTSEVDAEGKPYIGASKYVMHFAKGDLPPVNGFWSLTMYNDEILLLRRPAQSLHAQRPQRSAAERDASVATICTCSTWIRAPRRNPTGSPLPRRFHPDVASLWPTEDVTVDSRRHLEDSAGEEGPIGVLIRS